jgi:hypothetical protein
MYLCNIGLLKHRNRLNVLFNIKLNIKRIQKTILGLENCKYVELNSMLTSHSCSTFIYYYSYLLFDYLDSYIRFSLRVTYTMKINIPLVYSEEH